MVSTVSRIRRISVDLLVYLYIIEIGDWGIGTQHVTVESNVKLSLGYACYHKLRIILLLH